MKKLLVTVLMLMVLGTVGCQNITLQLQDETQLENLQVLKEAHSSYHDYFESGEVPPEFLVDSVDGLIDAAIELEESKAESWQDQARNEGWTDPDADEEETE